MENLIERLIAYEDDLLDDNQQLVLFSELIKTGMAWKLQGFYGRTAESLIKAGLLNSDGEILKPTEDEEVRREVDSQGENPYWKDT